MCGFEIFMMVVGEFSSELKTFDFVIAQGSNYLSWSNSQTQMAVLPRGDRLHPCRQYRVKFDWGLTRDANVPLAAIMQDATPRRNEGNNLSAMPAT
jgi:hypothetical protein